MAREESESRILTGGPRSWLTRVSGRRLRLSSDARSHAWLPPVDRREFWATQVFVLMIAAIHSWLEYQHVLDEHSPVYLFPTTLYLIPIVYAAVNFGLRGALLTALWSAILVVPNILLWHDGLERAGEIAQVAWITIAAVFVGGRVDRERSARLEAEFRERRQHESEKRYRAIVDNVGEPIIVLAADWRIIEVNAAAATLLGHGILELRGHRPPGLTGQRIIEALERNARDGVAAHHLELGEPGRWYAPVGMSTADAFGDPTTQLLLVDVTASHEREQGLQSITRQTLTAREEEQRRIARELHDGPLQSLMLLWRELDTIAAGMDEGDRHRLLEARGTTESIADELRRFSRDLRPSILDDLGITAALRAEAESLRQRSGLLTEVQVIGSERRLGGELEVSILRISQEALRNIERHAQASEARIILAFTEDRVRLRIIDDGVGLEPVPTPSELLTGGHLGIIGMQERARMVGASLELASAATGGLEVIVECAPSAREPLGQTMEATNGSSAGGRHEAGS